MKKKNIFYSTERIGIGGVHIPTELHIYPNPIYKVIFNGRTTWMDQKQYNEFLMCNPNPSHKFVIKNENK